MEKITLWTCRTLALVIAGTLAAGPALADKPEWTGEKGGKHERKEEGKGQGKKREHNGADRERGGMTVRGYFGDRQRAIANDYYVGQFRAGHCPPGLAKKHNGCLPPGQAKKWRIGYPLPRDVVYYDVPSALVVELGRPPQGYRYVRVASDILLIAVGTHMVVDALQDLGR
jgi:Ni/Co efflux regulator RcnB